MRPLMILLVLSGVALISLGVIFLIASIYETKRMIPGALISIVGFLLLYLASRTTGLPPIVPNKEPHRTFGAKKGSPPPIVQKKAHRTVGIILLTSFCLIFAYIFAHPAYHFEPPLPSGIPNNLLQKDVSWKGIDMTGYMLISEEISEFVFIYNGSGAMENPNATLRVYFKSCVTLEGIWTGSDATLIFKGPYTVTFPAQTRRRSWGDTIWGENEKVEPYLDVIFLNFSLNNLLNKCLHNWVEVEVSMDIRYPFAISPWSFVNEEASLDRSFRFYVVSLKDSEMLQAHEDWEYGFTLSPFVFPWVSIVLTFFGSILIIYEVKCQYRQRKGRWKGMITPSIE